MARHIKDFQTGADAQTVHNAISNYLMGEGYEYIQYDGENVFKKGQGVWSNPSFFKFSYSGNMVRMETWMKYAFFPGVYVGELGLTGFVGSAMKGPWKKRITNIEAILANFARQTPIQQQNFAPVSQSNYDDNATQLLNEDDSEGTCILDDNKPEPVPKQANSSGTEYCTSCGTQLPAGTMFCSVCGQKRQQVTSTGAGQTNYSQVNNQQVQVNVQPNTYITPNDVQLPPPGQPVSRKEFIDKYAQPSFKKDIRNIAILCYVCAGITFLLSCLINPFGIIDALVLLGFALGMHLGKSKVCAILILILSIIECVVGLVAGSFPFWWLIAGVSAVITFNKIEKQYKQFKNR